MQPRPAGGPSHITEAVEMKTRLTKFTLAFALTFLAAPALVQADTGSKGDAELAKKIRHELVMLPYYTIFDNLQYQVNGNTVILSGAVTRPTLKADAGR